MVFDATKVFNDFFCLLRENWSLLAQSAIDTIVCFVGMIRWRKYV